MEKTACPSGTEEPFSIMTKRLTGLVAAPFTALQPDGQLNLPLIDRQATALAANGVQGAFICGTTGEGFSLTSQERMQVAECWIAAAPKQLKGHCSCRPQQLG